MDKTIEIDGIKVHYLESGPEGGKPLIMMCGWLCNAHTLDSVQRVAEETHRVYNIDLPGFGESQEPPSEWGVDDYAEFLHKFAEKLGLESTSLLGHSYGGRVAILYASRHKVGKVILVDAAGIRRFSLKRWLKTRQFKLAKWLAPYVMGRERAQRWVDEQRQKRSSADYLASSPMMRKVMSKSLGQDLRHAMPGIKAPTLLIWGEKDTATPLRDAKTMERLIPDAGLVSFPGCGHYSFLDNPAQFSAVLRSFLRS